MRFRDLATELAEAGLSVCDMAAAEYDDPAVAARVLTLRQSLRNLREHYG